MFYIRFALALDVLLTALQRLSPEIVKDVLPLGGDPFVQLSVLLLLAVAIHEFTSNKKENR